ncbi:unnamed protein product, partial [Durusdinium trenchii]
GFPQGGLERKATARRVVPKLSSPGGCCEWECSRSRRRGAATADRQRPAALAGDLSAAPKGWRRAGAVAGEGQSVGAAGACSGELLARAAADSAAHAEGPEGGPSPAESMRRATTKYHPFAAGAFRAPATTCGPRGPPRALGREQVLCGLLCVHVNQWIEPHGTVPAELPSDVNRAQRCSGAAGGSEGPNARRSEGPNDASWRRIVSLRHGCTRIILGV